MQELMNGYDLSRAWFDWCFENPEKVSPHHTAIYFFAIEHCNRLGWKEKFGFPTQMTMDAVGIKKHQTYIRYFSDLVEWGFLKLVEKSKNQYSANIISLQGAMPKNGKALDKASIKHWAKQSESTGQSTGQSNGSIDKQLTINNKTINISFDIFWELYDKKNGEKNKLQKKWNNLKDEERQAVVDFIPKYKLSQPDKKYRKNPETFLNNKSWQDELIGFTMPITPELKEPQEKDFWNYPDYEKALKEYKKQNGHDL
jgi:hypothetical protein